MPRNHTNGIGRRTVVRSSWSIDAQLQESLQLFDALLLQYPEQLLIELDGGATSARRFGQPMYEALFAMLRAEALRWLNRPGEAMLAYCRSADICRNLSHPGLAARAMFVGALCAREYMAASECNDYLATSRLLFSDGGDHARGVRVLGAIIDNAPAPMSERRGFERHREAVSLAIAQADSQLLGETLIDYALHLASRARKHERAMSYLGRSIKLAHCVGARGVEARAHRGRANIHIILHQESLAVVELDKATAISEEIGDLHALAEGWLCRACIYAHDNQTSPALDAMAHALSLYDDVEDPSDATAAMVAFAATSARRYRMEDTLWFMNKAIRCWGASRDIVGRAIGGVQALIEMRGAHGMLPHIHAEKRAWFNMWIRGPIEGWFHLERTRRDLAVIAHDVNGDELARDPELYVLAAGVLQRIARSHSARAILRGVRDLDTHLRFRMAPKP